MYSPAVLHSQQEGYTAEYSLSLVRTLHMTQTILHPREIQTVTSIIVLQSGGTGSVSPLLLVLPLLLRSLTFGVKKLFETCMKIEKKIRKNYQCHFTDDMSLRWSLADLLMAGLFSSTHHLIRLSGFPALCILPEACGNYLPSSHTGYHQNDQEGG